MSAGPGEVFVTVHQAESRGLQSPFVAFISPQALISLRLTLGSVLSHTNPAKLSHRVPGCGRKRMQTVPVPARGVSCLSFGEAGCPLTSPWPGIKSCPGKGTSQANAMACGGGVGTWAVSV